MFSTLPDRRRALAEVRTPREALLLAEVAAFGVTVPWLTRLPLPRLARLVSRTPRGRRHPAPAEIERLDRLVGLAPRVAGPFVRRGCLTRGLTLFWFLRRAGLEVELRFGLDPRAAGDPGLDVPEIDGHCWLTLAGEPFLEKVDPRPRFAETYRLPQLVP